MKQKYQSKQNKTGRIAEIILEYILILGISLIFALYMSGRVGWFFFIAIIAAPIISILISFILSKFVVLEFSGDKTIILKNETKPIQIKLINNSFLPIPFVRIKIQNSSGLEIENGDFAISSYPKRSEEIQINVKGIYSGRGEIWVENARLYDFLGIVKFKIKINGGKMIFGVLPQAEEVSTRANYIGNVLSYMAGIESEETISGATNFTTTGFPGYDYREYVPGDSLRRINWKLSAGRQKLYVRLDEAAADSEMSMILYKVKKDINDAKGLSHALEKYAGTLYFFINNGICVHCLIFQKNTWEDHEIRTVDEVADFVSELAFYDEEKSITLPAKNDLKETCEIIFCFEEENSENNASVFYCVTGDDND